MAAFERAKYQANDGTIHPLRISEDRVAAAGAAPAGDIDSDIRVKVSKGNTEFGIRPRGVRLARTIGEGENAFTKYSFLPILTESVWDGLALQATLTIGGIEWTIIAKIAEDF